MLNEEFLKVLADLLPGYTVTGAKSLTGHLIGVTGPASDGKPFTYSYELHQNETFYALRFPDHLAAEIADQVKREREKLYPTVYTVADFEAEAKKAAAMHLPGWNVYVNADGYADSTPAHKVRVSQGGRVLFELRYSLDSLFKDLLWRQKLWYDIKKQAQIELGPYYNPLENATT